MKNVTPLHTNCELCSMLPSHILLDHVRSHETAQCEITHVISRDRDACVITNIGAISS